jgi:drug/metabolite transporter (DMT)-like permease
MFMLWLILALLASIFWGLTYVIQESLFRYITVTTYLTIVSFFTFVIIGILGIRENTLIPNIKTILDSKELMIWVFAAIVIYIAAELCIGFSIEGKNSTLAGLIEISYPLFIVLFSFLIFRQNHLTFGTIIGGIFIACGVVVISLTHK